MKLPAEQVELAASQEESRYALQAVKLDVANKRLMATDGHILAIVPVEVSDTDHDALLTVDSMKEMRKMQRKSKSIPLQVAVDGKVSVSAPGQSAEFETTTGQFPNVDMVIPKFEGPPTITLNVEMLYRLAKAIEQKGYSVEYEVALWIKDANSAVLVKGTTDGAIGVLMPCRGKYTPDR